MNIKFIQSEHFELLRYVRRTYLMLYLLGTYTYVGMRSECTKDQGREANKKAILRSLLEYWTNAFHYDCRLILAAYNSNLVLWSAHTPLESC